MKKRIYFIVLCAVLAFAINACSDACKTCRNVTYDSNGNETKVSTDWTEYCGLELVTIEAMPDTEIGGNVTKWECY